MRERKVYQMRKGLEHQCVAEDSKIRLYLSLVQGEVEEREDNAFEKAEVTVISLFFGFSVAYFTSLWVVPMAYAERGYQAYGGEYLVIVIAFLVADGTMNQFFKYFRRGSWRKEK